MNPAKISDLFGRLTLRQTTVALFVLSSVVYALSPHGRPPYTDLLRGGETMLTSLHLARDGQFANPFYWIPTGPTAHVAPVYVFLYALIASLFGVGRSGAIVLWALNIAFLSFQLALLPVLSDAIELGTAPGALGAVLALIVQPFQVLPEWEALLTGALIVPLFILTVKLFKSPSEAWRYVPLGLLWGLAILTNPECVLLLFLWAHVAAMENSTEILARARRLMLVVVAGAALACLPWFVRNYEAFHAVFFVRDNFGLELYTSNNPCAGPTAYGNLMSGCHWLTHPYGNRAITEQVAQKGEVAFNRELLHRGLAWIASNPRAFARLTAERFASFWFPDLGGKRYSIPMGILTVLSLVGIPWIYRERRMAAALLGSTLLVFPLVHYIVQVEARYRYPILWATFLPAAYALLKLVHRPREASPIATAANEEHEASLVK